MNDAQSITCPTCREVCEKRDCATNFALLESLELLKEALALLSLKDGSQPRPRVERDPSVEVVKKQLQATAAEADHLRKVVGVLGRQVEEYRQQEIDQGRQERVRKAIAKSNRDVERGSGCDYWPDCKFSAEDCYYHHPICAEFNTINGCSNHACDYEHKWIE